MEYKTQQNKLFPSLARVFAFAFTVRSLREAYDFTQESIEELEQSLASSTKNERGENDSNLNEALEKADFALAELHMLSCGLKAFITQEVANSIDTCKSNGRTNINFLQVDYPNHPGPGLKTVVEIAHEENLKKSSQK